MRVNSFEAVHFATCQLNRKGGYHLGADLVLQFEDVLDRAVIAFGPQVAAA